MNLVSKVQVLRLYKDLLRYGQQLKYSDKQYFTRRIKTEFKKNKDISEEDKINFNFEGVNNSNSTYGSIMILGSTILSNLIRPNIVRITRKVNIDYSKVPVLIEQELEEKFVRGSGPGGQKINKTSSAVFLKHLPTGIFVKCHQSRSLDQNRKTARDLLISKLDNLVNGENSVENQKKAIEAKKHLERNRRRHKMKEMKKEWLREKATISDGNTSNK